VIWDPFGTPIWDPNFGGDMGPRLLRDVIARRFLRGIIEVVIAKSYCRMFFRDVIAGRYCGVLLQDVIAGRGRIADLRSVIL
jgi:hypothetical protein